MIQPPVVQNKNVDNKYPFDTDLILDNFGKLYPKSKTKLDFSKFELAINKISEKAMCFINDSQSGQQLNIQIINSFDNIYAMLLTAYHDQVCGLKSILTELFNNGILKIINDFIRNPDHRYYQEIL